MTIDRHNAAHRLLSLSSLIGTGANRDRACETPGAAPRAQTSTPSLAVDFGAPSQKMSEIYSARSGRFRRRGSCARGGPVPPPRLLADRWRQEDDIVAAL